MLDEGILRDDTYRLFVPIQGDELLKSVEIDENGDYIVQGVMTSEDKDEEEDSITPEGMDCTYFLDKGWIKYEHGNSPSQFIGEPVEVKVGQFEHPTLHKLVKGIFVKGRLFAQRELAKQAVAAIEDLQKSKTKRTMGWSIEGNVKERDRKTGKIVKSVLRNVVLTMNPVNTMTWAELAKSFSKNHVLSVDMDKSLDTAGAATTMPQSIEGYNPKEDEQEKWIKLFREFVKNHFLQKSLRTEFIASTPGAVGMTAYNFALEHELDNEGAYKFATYIADRHEVLKSLFGTNFGGEKKMQKLSEMLDTDLEDLRKSLEIEDIDGEELEKSIDDGDKEDSEGNKEGSEGDGDDDNTGGSEGDGDGDGDNDNKEGSEGDGDGDDNAKEGSEGDGDGDTEKSIKTDFAKSFAANEENQQAFEVSDFLLNLVDEVGYHMDGFSKSMTLVTKQQSTITKSLIAVGELIKGLSDKVENLQAENDDLKKSLNEVLQRPVGRKSVVSTREVETIKKSIGSEGGKQLTRKEIGDVLMKSFEAGEIPGTTISRFEAGVGLNALNLPKSVVDKLGM